MYRERNPDAPAFVEENEEDFSLHDPIGTDKDGNEKGAKRLVPLSSFVCVLHCCIFKQKVNLEACLIF
ncbi:hypothetical protein BC351_13970 [Paenibacillus ferrarius]|uniref:Uncharacterized protein n=1 Tax=Paenibacillus ferrarius TaxID=1469647 RepID=A0A1V4H6S8_9BACL|nr:hypothetical protein BC351_13970 [Paenibacillus ferrarius]